MTLPADAPAGDEIEISVFGKGLGEAIIVHLGGGRWVTVDSIGVDGKSLSCLYLDQIGVDVATQIDLVVATHWHDDHVMGLSNLFGRAAAAELVISPAMLNAEFAKFIAAFSGQAGKKFSSGVQEIGEVLEIALSRKAEGSRWPIVRPGPGQPLWRRAPGALPHGKAVTLEALSPSEFDRMLFLARIAGTRPDPRVLQQARVPGPNDISVALHVTLGDDAILLGADLENRKSQDSGWNAVLSSPVAPTTQATLLKVPHHGGVSAHHAGMWTQMLQPRPLATITPWQRGGKALPSKADITRIQGLASVAYVTAPSAIFVGPREPTIVTKALKKNNLILRRLSNNLGHVRHRGTFQGSKIVWRTELFGAACRIEEMAA